MKLKKKTIIYMMTGALMAGTLTSCSSDFLKEYSQDLGRVNSVDDLNELLVGDCYLPLGYFNITKGGNYEQRNKNYAILHFMSDELQENIPEETYDNDGPSFRQTMYPYFTWQQNLYQDVDSKNSLEDDENTYWTLAYEKINNCNMLLAESNNIAVGSDTEKAKLQRIQGECYFLRAFYYLTLANLYGKPYSPATAATDPAVPIKISESVEDKEFERASVAAVYQQVIDDLTQAEQLLQDVKETLTIYHANIEALYILRSRVALYMQDWQTAADYAQKAINHKGELNNLVGDDGSNYPMSLNNPEVVYSNGSSMLGNMLFIHPQKASGYDNNTPIWIISDDLYGLYSDADARKVSYVTTEDDVEEHKPTYHKIDNSIASYGKYKEVSDVFSIRTAEAYLNMAEAKAEMGEDAEACSWLSKLRQKRMSEGADVNLSGAELIQMIRDERARELCLEGHRWFDLRRYSVDAKYPYSKEITHSITYFKSYYRSRVDYYKLEKNDAAYVLNIPKKVRDFQPSIGSNERPERMLQSSYQQPDDSGDEGDDDW